MYYLGKGSRLCPFPIMGSGHGRVTEPKGNQFNGRDLGMIPHAQVFSVSELKVFLSFLT